MDEESPMNDQSIDPYQQFTCALCNKAVSMASVSSHVCSEDDDPEDATEYEGQQL